MQRIWLVSDTHFNHTNIIKYTNRPFLDAESMNHALICNWNNVVAPDDIVFHLGDVGLFRYPDQAKTIIQQLNGKKILIYGNHDRRKWDWIDIGFIAAQRGPLKFQQYLFSHKPLIPSQNPDTLINIHGHIHDKTSLFEWQINISVEQTNYTPVQLMTGGYDEEKEEPKQINYSRNY